MSERESQVAKSDDDNISSKSNIAVLLNNDVKDENHMVTSKTSVEFTSPSKSKATKRKHNNGNNNSKLDDDGDSDDPTAERSYQIRPKLLENEERKSKSPRKTPESKEAKAKFESLLAMNEIRLGEGFNDYSKLTPRQQEMAAHSLAEINRKLTAVSWKPSE